MSNPNKCSYENDTENDYENEMMIFWLQHYFFSGDLGNILRFIQGIRGWPQPVLGHLLGPDNNRVACHFQKHLLRLVFGKKLDCHCCAYVPLCSCLGSRSPALPSRATKQPQAHRNLQQGTSTTAKQLHHPGLLWLVPPRLVVHTQRLAWAHADWMPMGAHIARAQQAQKVITYRLTNWLTTRLTHWLTLRLTYWLTNWLTYSYQTSYQNCYQTSYQTSYQIVFGLVLGLDFGLVLAYFIILSDFISVIDGKSSMQMERVLWRVCCWKMLLIDI